MAKDKGDHLTHCTVERAVGNQWAVWGHLSWTKARAKEYAICPTKDAAEAARRLLSGDALKMGTTARR